MVQSIGMFIILSGVFVISVCKSEAPENMIAQENQEGSTWEKFGCIGASKIKIYCSSL